MDVAVAMGCGSIGDVEHRAIAGIVGGQRVGHEVSFNVIANGLRSLRTATTQSSDTARSGGALDCFAALAMTKRAWLAQRGTGMPADMPPSTGERKSTRLNSSH